MLSDTRLDTFYTRRFFIHRESLITLEYILGAKMKMTIHK